MSNNSYESEVKLRNINHIILNRINRIELDYGNDYITTNEIIDKFIDYCTFSNINISNLSLLIIAQSWHAPRCIDICKSKGLKVVAGRFSDKFSNSDPQSWVRNAFSWILKEGTKK